MLSIAAFSLLSVAAAQKVGTFEEEVHPPITWQRCSAPGSCETIDTEIVLDSNWRWIHTVGDYQNCYEGADWTGVCTSNEDCAENCAVEGADYEGTYGITTSGDALTLDFVTGSNVGSRTYLMETPDTYQMFDLIGNEFTFDVDLSTVPCGMNSALYFVAMEADGGSASYPVNEAGARYGVGYCDSQCARDLKFIAGQGNYDGWEESSSDANAGVGGMGACCAEIDVWESNSHSFALTPHACEIGFNDYHVCVDGVDKGCGGTYSEERYAGRCDANGCDYNPYRMGVTDFYGEGKTVDTSQPFTVVTRFTADSMSQFFIQNGQEIQIPTPAWDGLPDSNVVDAELCDVLFDVFEEDTDRYADVGGWPAMREALEQPHVLVMSIWADHYANMLWLDGLWPRGADPDVPGHLRGDCAPDSGIPSEVVANYGDSYVTWSNIKFGPIGSTT